MEISQEEFDIIEEVIYPVVLKNLEVSFQNINNFSQESFETMLSGRYHDEWLDDASQDFLDTKIKPVAWRVWAQVSRILGIYSKEPNVITFTEEQLEKIIIATGVTYWEDFNEAAEDRTNEIQRAYSNGKGEGLRNGFWGGFIFIIILLVILYNVL